MYSEIFTICIQINRSFYLSALYHRNRVLSGRLLRVCTVTESYKNVTACIYLRALCLSANCLCLINLKHSVSVHWKAIILIVLITITSEIKDKYIFSIITYLIVILIFLKFYKILSNFLKAIHLKIYKTLCPYYLSNNLFKSDEIIKNILPIIDLNTNKTLRDH